MYNDNLFFDSERTRQMYEERLRQAEQERRAYHAARRAKGSEFGLLDRSVLWAADRMIALGLGLKSRYRNEPALYARN